MICIGRTEVLLMKGSGASIVTVTKKLPVKKVSRAKKESIA